MKTFIKKMTNLLREDNKDSIKELLIRMLDSDKDNFLQLMKILDLKIRKNYIDINTKPIGSIVYNYKDFEE